MVYLRKLISNVFFLTYFIINYVLHFMYRIFNGKLWKWKWKYYDLAGAINCTRKLTCMCACACACDRTRLREQYVVVINRSILSFGFLFTRKWYIKWNFFSSSSYYNFVKIKQNEMYCQIQASFISFRD